VKVFIPFTNLRAETFAALHPFSPVLVPLLDDLAYSRYFIERWRDGESFINVEHDVAPTSDQIKELMECPEPWCAFHYQAMLDCLTKRGRPDLWSQIPPVLGCVKISSDFIAAHPNLWVERQWGNCDVYLQTKAVLPSHGHQGAVKHLHFAESTLEA
jgi:hypothetical protein